MSRRLFSQSRRERWYQLVLERLILLRKTELETIAKQTENHKQQLLIDDLKAKLDINSRNSSKPPSSD